MAPKKGKSPKTSPKNAVRNPEMNPPRRRLSAPLLGYDASHIKTEKEMPPPGAEYDKTPLATKTEGDQRDAEP
eukprot:60444-Heterocapsa_arctica.AAC.1